MKWRLLVCGLLVAAALGAGGVVAEIDLVDPVREGWSEPEGSCPYEKSWVPTHEQLEKIFRAHDLWLRKDFPERSTLPARASLCNADLRGVDLRDAKLQEADLRNADLRNADLRNADLQEADLQEADLRKTDLQEADLREADLREAKLQEADLRKADLRNAKLRETNLREAKLQEADLRKADLRKADLQEADLRDADLRGADLRNAKLRDAKLRGIDLQQADLRKADLRNADLQWADLHQAKFQKANLQWAVLCNANLREANLQWANLQKANLQWARLVDTNVEQAILAFVQLDHATYQPNSSPPDGYVNGIEGLKTVEFGKGEQRGLLQLRELFRASGLRKLEREATFAIEHNRNLYERKEGTPIYVFLGWLSYIFVERTTGWGLYPSYALMLLLYVMLVSCILYAVLMGRALTRHEIVRVVPAGSIMESNGKLMAKEKDEMESLSVIAGHLSVKKRWLLLLRWALYFSLLSAFRIGWRDFSVGTWLTRLQWTEYTLRGRGWVRAVSGLQSLISVYLLAICVLTQFGRPFQ